MVQYRVRGAAERDYCLLGGWAEGLSFMVSFLESSVKTPKKPKNFSRTLEEG
jgi:hypothetical protein